MLDIKVKSWGYDVSTADVEAVLRDAATHLYRPLRKPVEETVIVANDADHDPMTCYRTPIGQGPITVRLNVEGCFWAQLAYQAAHEFCHVMQQYETLMDSANNWFHETICEVASLFTLRQMSGVWRTRPPYPHWAEYADKLAQYADSRIDCPARQLPQEVSLSEYVAGEQESLRNDKYQRDKNGTIANRLLPLFENDQSGWNAITRLPPSSPPIDRYLEEWGQFVEQPDQAFVSRIRILFFGSPRLRSGGGC